jgi:hypothetical protein
MKHHNNIGTSGEGGLIAGLLVPAISSILLVPYCMNAYFICEICGAVGARIVGQDDVIDDLSWDFINSSAQGSDRVVCGENDGNPPRIQHFDNLPDAKNSRHT